MLELMQKFQNFTLSELAKDKENGVNDDGFESLQGLGLDIIKASEFIGEDRTSPAPGAQAG